MDGKTKIIIYFLLGFISVGFLMLILNNLQRSSVRSDKLQVAASFYPLYYFSQQIGGIKAKVMNITPAGAEPHDYEPTAQDIARIENCKLLILNGGGLEPWADSIKQNLASQKIVVVTVVKGLTNRQVTEKGDYATDPHIWLSPTLAEEIVKKINQGFIQVDPVNKGYYQSNADMLEAELANLDKEYRQGLSNCLGKNIITSHAAFGYLVADYGLHQVSIAGLSPDAEPSPLQLADIVKFVKANNVKYIFFESLVSPKLSEIIANEVGAKILVLNPIEGLSNEEISQGKNYFTEMRTNLAHLKTALQCK